MRLTNTCLCVQGSDTVCCGHLSALRHSVIYVTCAQTVAGDMIVNNNFDMTALFTSNIVKLQVHAQLEHSAFACPEHSIGYSGVECA